MCYLTHILPDTVSCDTEKIQTRLIGNAFAIRDEQVVELRNLADKPDKKRYTFTKKLYFKVLFANNSKTNFTVEFSIAASENIAFTLFDPAGHALNLLVKKYFRQGLHRIGFHTGRQAAGLYLIRMQVGNYSVSRKIKLM